MADAVKLELTRGELYLALCELTGVVPAQSAAWRGNILHAGGSQVWVYRASNDPAEGQVRSLVEIPETFAVDDLTPGIGHPDGGVGEGEQRKVEEEEPEEKREPTRAYKHEMAPHKAKR